MWRRLAALFSKEPEQNWIRKSLRAAMSLSELDALRVALAVLDAVELIPAAARAPVLVSDLERQAKHPA